VHNLKNFRFSEYLEREEMKKNARQVALKTYHKEIISILEEKCALNAYEIFEHLKERENISISQTTVYRALNYMVENHLLKPVNLNDGHNRYELISKENHHHHFICTNCQQLYPVECPFETVEKLLPEGFKVNFHNFEIFGICKDCSV